METQKKPYLLELLARLDELGACKLEQREDHCRVHVHRKNLEKAARLLAGMTTPDGLALIPCYYGPFHRAPGVRPGEING